MKLYQIWISIFKIALIIQLGLIFAKIQTEDHEVYLITDMVFKMSLGLFLMVYFYIRGHTRGFDGIDEIFISFGGALLFFDALYNVFPKLLKKYGIYFNPYTLYWSNKPEVR